MEFICNEALTFAADLSVNLFWTYTFLLLIDFIVLSTFSSLSFKTETDLDLAIFYPSYRLGPEVLYG